MASEGPLYPSVGASNSVTATGENANGWLSPENITADDGVNASVTAATYDSPDITFRLQAESFAFSIPTDATIDGVVVEIERFCDAGSASDNRVQLAKGTTDTSEVGDNKAATATAWPGTAGVATYGGAADLWGTTWTPAEINSANFAVFLSVQADSANTDVHVDYIRVTVHYTEANPSATIDSVLPALIQAVTAESLLEAALAQVLPALDQAATASLGGTAEASITQVLPALIQAMTADAVIEAALVQVLPALSQAGNIEPLVEAVLAQGLPALTQAVLAVNPLELQGASVLPALVQQLQAGNFAALELQGASDLPALEQQLRALVVRRVEGAVRDFGSRSPFTVLRSRRTRP